MQFFGAICFIDDTRKDRITNACDFKTVADWFQYVIEFYTQEVASENFDGSEIMIGVYSYTREGETPTWFDIDSDSAIEVYSITNPSYFGSLLPEVIRENPSAYLD